MNKRADDGTPRRVLFVGTGAPGGIGRVEQMVAEAATCDGTSFADDVVAIWRRRHPDYLREGAIASMRTTQPEVVSGGSNYVLSLIQAIRQTKPDYVLYSHANLARPAPWLRPFGHPARYGVWTYGIEIWDRLSALHRWALRHAETVLTISRFTAQRVTSEQGVASNRVHIIPLTLPTSMFESAGVTRQPDRGRLLTVARLASTEQGKNLDALIHAVAEVRDTVPSIALVIVGDGDDKHRLEALAESVGVSDIVSFPGRVSDAQLREEYERAQLFVLPSQKEGFGLVFVEAMLTGTPVLGLAVGGPLDIVRDGIDGRLIRDVSELPAMLSHMLSEPDELENMGVAARDHVIATFSPTRFRAEMQHAIAQPIGQETAASESVCNHPTGVNQERLVITKDVAREVTANVAMAVPAIREWRINRPRTGTLFSGASDELERYAFQAVRGIEAHAVRVEGKSIVEFGPGDTLAAGLAMLASGATRYAALDRFVPDYSSAKAKLWYRGVRDAWGQSFPDRPWPQDLDPTRFPEDFSDRILLLDGSVEEARSSERFDIVTSWQVGEHVNDIFSFARLTASLLKEDGVAVHRVDFGPHDCWRGYDDPLTFLRFSPSAWRAMGSHRGFPNRRRFHEFMRAWDAAGLSVQCEDIVPFDENKIDFARVHSSFSDAPRESMLIRGVVFVCRRK